MTDDHGERLARIETKLDIFLHDHETRIRGLEKGQWFVGGGAVTISVLVGLLAKKFGF